MQNFAYFMTWCHISRTHFSANSQSSISHKFDHLEKQTRNLAVRKNWAFYNIEI